MTYRLGVDGDRSWTVQVKKVYKDKKTGEDKEEWKTLAWCKNLEQAATDMFERQAKRKFTGGAALADAVFMAKAEVLNEVRRIGLTGAKEEIRECVSP